VLHWALPELVLDTLKALGSDPDAFCSETTGNWIILLDPEKVKLALDRVLLANGIDILLHTRVAAVTRTANRIHSITLAGMSGRIRLSAQAFVDATGDANLALIAGIDCRQGNGKNQFRQHLVKPELAVWTLNL